MHKLYMIQTPFKGIIAHSLTVHDCGKQTVDYTGYLYRPESERSKGDFELATWLELHPEDCFLKTINDVEFEEIHKNYEINLVTAPKEIDLERWEDMLNVLPPCRWDNFGPYQCFHVSERLTGNLVSWFAKEHGEAGRYFEFNHLANIKTLDLIEHIKKGLK